MFAAIVAVAAAYTLGGSAPRAFAVWVSGPAAAPPAGTFEMRNVNRTFTPAAIVVSAGSQVRFPNDDPFEHSIYSIDTPNAFDIGYYGTGPGKYVTFSHPGVVHVRCHIHGYMRGVIVVAGGPFTVVRDGRYELQGLPAGDYVVHEVDADGSERTEGVVLSGDKTLNF